MDIKGIIALSEYRFQDYGSEPGKKAAAGCVAFARRLLVQTTLSMVRASLFSLV